MSPTAVLPSTSAEPVRSSVSSLKGPVLVIGSPHTAQDGRYQSVITKLGVDRQVDKLMLDRIVEGATTLSPSYYSTIHITLAPADYESLKPQVSSLVSQLLESLVPLGTIHLTSVLPAIGAELTLGGFTILPSPDEGAIMAQKPSYGSSTTMPLKLGNKGAEAGSTTTPAPAIALPLRKKTNSAAKKALWALNAPSVPKIDDESLLRPEDKQRPIPTCEPVSASAPRRKKACKNCSCGLKELEEEELETGKVVVLDGSVNGFGTAEVTRSERERLLAAAAASPKATSSCGNCYLGDAFRCAGCPYIGLPAFKPGEKVQIDLSMDDI